MTQVSWLLQDTISKDNAEELKSTIESQGLSYKSIDYIPFESRDYSDLFPTDACVVSYGPLNFIRQIQRTCSWIPGAYCNLANLQCSTYYQYLGRFLLNRDYIFLPIKDLHNRKDWIYEVFGVCDYIFIRPNSGFKPFTGQILHRDKMDC